MYLAMVHLNGHHFRAQEIVSLNAVTCTTQTNIQYSSTPAYLFEHSLTTFSESTQQRSVVHYYICISCTSYCFFLSLKYSENASDMYSTTATKVCTIVRLRCCIVVVSNQKDTTDCRRIAPAQPDTVLCTEVLAASTERCAGFVLLKNIDLRYEVYIQGPAVSSCCAAELLQYPPLLLQMKHYFQSCESRAISSDIPVEYYGISISISKNRTDLFVEHCVFLTVLNGYTTWLRPTSNARTVVYFAAYDATAQLAAHDLPSPLYGDGEPKRSAGGSSGEHGTNKRGNARRDCCTI